MPEELEQSTEQLESETPAEGAGPEGAESAPTAELPEAEPEAEG